MFPSKLTKCSSSCNFSPTENCCCCHDPISYMPKFRTGQLILKKRKLNATVSLYAYLMCFDFGSIRVDPSYLTLVIKHKDQKFMKLLLEVAQKVTHALRGLINIEQDDRIRSRVSKTFYIWKSWSLTFSIEHTLLKSSDSLIHDIMSVQWQYHKVLALNVALSWMVEFVFYFNTHLCHTF